MEELYQQNGKIVYHYLCSLCHDNQLAEDLTQETLLQAYKSIDRYDGSCKVSSWLCQIGKHLYYQHLHKNNRHIPTEFEDEQFVSEENTEQKVLAKVELMEVFKGMQKLTHQMREVIYLRTMGELSFKEIGQIVGKSENWARVNFYRGKEILLKERKKYE